MLNKFSLTLVTDRRLIEDGGIIEVVQAAVDGGVNAVQLREKGGTARETVEIGKKLEQLLHQKKIPLIINDRIDIAQAIDADGVHLGQSDISYTDARRIIGRDKIIGLTIENLSQADGMKQFDVDYIGVSSIYPSATKKDVNNFWSKNDIQQLKKRVSAPLIGIGGINKFNAGQALSYGIDGIAVASAICGEPTIAKIKEASRTLKRIIEEHNGH